MSRRARRSLIRSHWIPCWKHSSCPSTSWWLRSILRETEPYMSWAARWAITCCPTSPVWITHILVTSPISTPDRYNGELNCCRRFYSKEGNRFPKEFPILDMDSERARLLQTLFDKHMHIWVIVASQDTADTLGQALAQLAFPPTFTTLEEVWATIESLHPGPG